MNEVDVESVNLRDAPDTDALLEQKELSYDTITSFWDECLKRGTILQIHKEWESDWITADAIYEAYKVYSDKMNERFPKSQTTFGGKIKKFCPTVKKDQVDAEVRGKIRRVNCYRFPSLNDCKREFEAKV